MLGCRNKVPTGRGWGLGSLKQQKDVVSQFWRQEVQDQGVRRAMLPLKGPGKDLFQASLLAPGGSPACAAQCPSSRGALLGVCPCAQAPLFVRTAVIGLGAVLLQHDLILSKEHLQQPCFQTRSRSEVLGVRTSIHEFYRWVKPSVWTCWLVGQVRRTRRTAVGASDIPPAVHDSPGCSTSLSALDIVGPLNLSHSVVGKHRGLVAWFQYSLNLKLYCALFRN